jgi:isocitrate dehydrogenase
MSEKNGNKKAQVLADALDVATEALLLNGKSPSRKVNELDNRGSHFYLAMYWAQELAKQDSDAELKAQFTKIAEELTNNEQAIVDQLNSVQGQPMDIGGYYSPDEKLASDAMRPSAILNKALELIG